MIPRDDRVGADGLMSRFEWRWLGSGLVVLAVILVVSMVFVAAHPGRIPMTEAVAPVETILASEMFRHPGVTRTGPNRFRAVVIARQYGFTPATIRVPIGADVDFFVTSADVVHGFTIPQGNVNVEVFPGYVAHVSATFPRARTYAIVCDQYCGIGHQNMLATFVVSSAAAFERTASASGSTPVVGSAVFATNCVACHQATGRGIPGTFPPLAGSLAEYTRSAAGRRTIAHVVLDGLGGPIRVRGVAYDGAMPAWRDRLNDREIAAVLEYVTTAWPGTSPVSGDAGAFGAAEIARAREPVLSSTAVAAERAKLETP